MAVGISLVVVLLVCWGGHWTHEQEHSVEIVVGRADVPGFNPENPTQFRAASGRHTFTCMVTGGTGNIAYQWSSTCDGCPFANSASMAINRGAVASYDTGTHTCMATRNGDIAMDSITITIVGAGIQIFTGTSDPSFPDAQVPVANNALVIARQNLAGDFRLRIVCRSDSIMESSTRQIIGRNGAVIETDGPFLIERDLLGEITIYNTNDEPSVVTSNDQGIYTCRIQLQNGEIRDINIGIYPFNFDTQPTITNPLMYTPGSSSSTLTCTSTGSPATTVTFTRGGTDIGPLRDGESAMVGGISYQLAQTVTSRTQSTYENVLTINAPQSTLAGNTFTCTVENTLGTATPQSFETPAPLTVGIAVAYTPPPGSTPGPNEYRAASGPVVVTCTASGGAGSGPTYQWSSTCACVFREGTSESLNRIITRSSVRSADTGTHTCTATRGGESASSSIEFTVVGAGIHVIEGASNTVGPQPNNGLVVSDNPGSGDRIDFLCRSNALALNVRELIGLDENPFSGNTFLRLINPTVAGELRIENTVGTEQTLSASEQGIYTCRIALENGDLSMINIGVYPIGFNTQPTVNDPLVFTPGSPSSLTCTSTGSPATTVTFRRGSTDIGPLRDGEPAMVGGTSYQLAQTVTSRTQSTYQNVLTINEPLDSLVGASFTCTVENTLGSGTSSNPITIQAIEFTRSPPTVTVGDTVTYTCTSVLGTATIAWLDTADGNAVLETDSGVTELNLVLNRIPQSMDNRVYTCRVTLDSTPTTRDLTVEIQAPIVTATIAVSGPRVVGGDIILTCSVDGLNSLASDTTIEFRGPRDDMGSGSTSFQLSLNSARFSDDGQYMCIATVSSTLLNNDVTVTDTDVVTLDLRISNPQVEITRNGGTPLYVGIVLTLTCRITVVGVPANMLSNVEVSRTWRGAGGGDLSELTNSRITVSSIVLDSGTTYTSTAVFNTLVTSNMGDYTCEANIGSTVSSVEGSETVVEGITLNIELPTLTLSVVPSTTRLPDVAPYNTFNVTCIATAPEGVMLAKAFVWHRANAADGSCTDFPVVADNIMDSNLNQPVSTSVLNVTETAIGTLRFCCQASITELSVSGTPNDVSSIEIVGPAPPMPPTNVRIVSAGATTATVAWTVPLIVYTPETYVVRYSTSTAKRQVLMSDQVESGADFDEVNQTFSVNLIELEPSTAYSLQVLSGNSEDSSTSEPQSLTTTSGGGGGSNGGAIAGGIIGAIIAIVLIVLIILFVAWWWRRRDDTVKSSYVQAPSARETTAITAGRDPIRYTRPAEEIHMEKIVAPVIQEFPESDLAFTEGEGLHFAVHVTGVPTPSTAWYLDGKELVSDYAVDVAGDGSLTIPSVEPRHSGTYKLVVTNQGGSMDRTVMVSVFPETEATPSVSRRQQQLDVTSIPVAEFGKYVATNHSNNNQGFRDLYAALDTGDDHTVTVATTPKNKPLNRFANITVYDDNRIMLQPLPGHSDCQRDYINACYVDGYSIPNKFIATQGPLPKTNVDFWRLVWQERPPSIVMVTNLREGNKIKCQQYWPESGNKSFGPFQITITDQQTFADYNIRTFRVSLSSSSERPLKVTQFHFTAWPDHGVPEYATPILSFHRRVVAHHVPSRGPLLVHCSAGVGRTGTFITINGVLEQIQKEQVIDVFNTVDKIRKQRMKLVQTVEQYIFVHDAVLESVTCGDTQIAATDFRFAMRKLEGADPQTRLTGFESQFKVLHQVSPKPDEVRRDAALRHREDNRSLDYLPPDQHRVVLKGEVPDYIHAVSANGYKQQKAFIIAENPTQKTCRNFWKMLYSRKCAAIVMLSQVSENGKEACFQYWPTSGVKQFGEFTVDLLGEEKLEGFVLRTLSVLDGKSGKAQQITQFHIVNWSPDGHCSNLKTVTDIIEEVSKVQRKTGNHPIAIHCSDTVCRSGMFCSIATTIERCKTEGVVDVFQVVKALRVQKPGAVLTVAQYQHVFEAILVFLDSFDTYANFQNI